MRPEDSETILIKIIVDETPIEELTDVAQWLIMAKIDHQSRNDYETYFRAPVPILLVPKLAHFPSVRKIEQIWDHPRVSPIVLKPAELGRILFVGEGACSSCHTITGIVDPGGVLGPRLDGIGGLAGTRRPGMSAKEYLRESILDPDAFIHESCGHPWDSECTPGLMAATMNSIELTDADVNNLIEFLLTLD